MCDFPPCHRMMMTDTEPVSQTGNRAVENIWQWLHLGRLFISDFTDSADMARRLSRFNGHVNNMLCNFSALDSFTLNRLFYIVAVIMGARWVTCRFKWLWGGQADWNAESLGYHVCQIGFTPLMASCLPFSETICRIVLNFIKLYLSSNSELVGGIVRHSARVILRTNVLRNQYEYSFLCRPFSFLARGFELIDPSLGVT